MGSFSRDLRTWSDSPVRELSSIFRSLPWIRIPSAGSRSPAGTDVLCERIVSVSTHFCSLWQSWTQKDHYKLQQNCWAQNIIEFIVKNVTHFCYNTESRQYYRSKNSFRPKFTMTVFLKSNIWAFSLLKCAMMMHYVLFIWRFPICTSVHMLFFVCLWGFFGNFLATQWERVPPLLSQQSAEGPLLFENDSVHKEMFWDLEGSC